MPAATHSIDRIIVDLAFDGHDGVRAVQERISGFCRDRFPGVLDGALEGFDGDGRDLVIERIELDIGACSAASTDAELAQRVAQALEACLRDVIAEQRDDPAACPEWARVVAFLADGERTSASPDSIVAEALRADPLALARSIRRWGLRQPARARLAQALSEPLRVSLLHLLAGRDADVIREYLGELTLVHRQRPLVADSAGGFGSAMWEFVWAYLLLDHGSHFNTRSFVASHLRRMAARYRIGYLDLLARLASYAATLAIPHASRYSLPNTLAELEREERAGARPAQDARAPDALRLRQLQDFLAFGAMPAGAAANSARTIVAALRERCPDELCQLLRRAATGDAARARLLAALGEQETEALVCLLEPADGARIVAHAASVRRIQAREHLVSAPAAPFAATVWEFVFRYLLAERGSQFNTRSFVKDMVGKLATRYGMRYDTFLLGLLAAAPAMLAGGAALPAILLSLADEALLAIAPAPLSGVDDAAAALEAFGQWLASGTCAPASARRRSPQALALMLFAHAPQSLAELIRACGARGVARMAAAFGDDLLHRMVYVLAPLQADAIGDGIAQVERAVRQSLPERGAGTFNRLSWEAVLGVLLVGPARFDAVDVVAAHVVQLSRRTRIAMPAVAAQLGTATAVVAGDDGQVIGAPAVADADALTLLLVHGVSPCPDVAAWLAQQDDAAVLAVLARFGLRAALLHRIAFGFGAAFRMRALALAARANAGSMRAFALAAAACNVRLGLDTGEAFSGQLAYCMLAFLNGAAPQSTFAPTVLRALAVRYRRGWQELAADLLAHDAHGDAMWQALAAAIAREPAPQPPGAALLAYLESGTVSAAAGSAARAALLDTLGQGAMLDADGRFVAQLRAMEDKAGVARRLVRHMPLAHLRRLLAMLMPAYAGLAESILLTAARAAGLLPGSIGQDRFVACHWEQLIEMLINADAIGWQAQRLLGELVARVAARLALPRAVYLDAMSDAAARQALAHQRFAPLFELLSGQLAVAHAQRPAADRDAHEQDNSCVIADTPRLDPCSALGYFIRYGAAKGAHDAAALIDAALGANAKQAQAIVQAASDLERCRFSSALTPARCRALALSALDDAPERQAWPVQEQEAAALPAGVPFHVSNAGLVLLWQFFHPYFSALGMLNGRAFASPAHQQRAVYLMQYLASGTFDAPAHELLLNKVLCGLDTSAPLAPCALLTEDERAYSEQLINTVTQHWAALKNTSADVLRATFLMRAASLVRGDKQWTLAVAPGPYDMLLQTLPWSLSTIRLSWMEDMLWVQWK